VISLLDNDAGGCEEGLTSLLPRNVRQKSFDEHQEDEEDEAHEDVHGLGHSDLQ
jgi:hypothetical protein